ncbi:hypothetical protein [Stakelama saccharophila]|uniref:YtxH domain-containing protein n=1 Tax=Stakelama saccharophila TaxID=3075605 RepID=A0ABZ0BC82_9SPHN|nr:hypothetical protein [Stakelama sp. W311]WNO55040.1 hypothetical protein RPR59_07295 [Stakelama sp. W311]
MTDTQTPNANSSQSGIRGKADDTISKTRDRASKAYGKSRETGRKATRYAGDSLDGNPLAMLVGGAAVGLLAGVLLPRTERETEMFGSTGKRLIQGATAAAAAARDAGKEEFEALAPDKGTAKSKASSIFGHVAKAAGDAGKSAVSGKKTA